MKAWQVRHPDEYNIIVFADTPGKAKMKAIEVDDFSGSCEPGSYEYEELYLGCRVTRSKEFDGRENNPPTDWELYEKHGWHFYCSVCNVEFGTLEENIGNGITLYEKEGEIVCQECIKKGR